MRRAVLKLSVGLLGIISVTSQAVAISNCDAWLSNLNSTLYEGPSPYTSLVPPDGKKEIKGRAATENEDVRLWCSAMKHLNCTKVPQVCKDWFAVMPEECSKLRQKIAKGEDTVTEHPLYDYCWLHPKHPNGY
jgi:hypothetical protein